LRSIGHRVVPFLLALTIAACDSSDPVTTPTTPTVVTKTDTFAGTLTSNAAATFPFVVAAAGSVTATLSTVTPSGAPAIGVGLGTWDGTTSVCKLIVTNDAATQGAVVSATTSGATNLCARVFDAGGTVVTAVGFSLQVVHP
jgi:hypothetical protein